MLPRATTLALMSLLLLGCRRGPRREVPPPEDEEPTAELAPPRAGPAPPTPRCTLAPTRWVLGAPDGGVDAPVALYEGGVVASAVGGGEWLAFLDPRAGALVVQTPTGGLERVSLGGGEVTAPVLGAMGDIAAVVTVVRRADTQVHRVFCVARQGPPRELFAQAEVPDEGASVTLATSPAGALLAWDDERARQLGGVVMAQFVPRGQCAAGASVVPPAPRPLSPPEHDAEDPVLVALPAGGFAALWLVAQQAEPDAGDADQAPTQLYARLLAADGAPTAPPVLLTPRAMNRFGVTALPRVGGGLWVAYRVAGDTDQQTRGDGGSVAVLRLGADLHPTASAAIVSAPNAEPSGEPELIAEGGAVTAYWSERRGEGLITVRRALGVDGASRGSPEAEPAFEGEVPVRVEGTELVVPVHGPRGEPGVARARCAAPGS